MGFFRLFSKRDQAPPETLQYDTLPRELRAKIAHAIGRLPFSNAEWDMLCSDLAENLGRIRLRDDLEVLDFMRGIYDWKKAYLDTVLQEQPSVVLDAIDMAAAFGDAKVSTRKAPSKAVDDEIRLINHRFAEHGVGYRIEGYTLVRVDNNVLHAEAVVPAMRLLHQPAFETPEKEYMRAHALFRRGDFNEAVVQANNAFESTLKVICALEDWEHDPQKDTASTLVTIAKKNGLFAGFVETNLHALSQHLLIGPRTRNNAGGHGAGTRSPEVPSHVAAYALHTAATSIVLLVESYDALKKNR